MNIRGGGCQPFGIDAQHDFHGAFGGMALIDVRRILFKNVSIFSSRDFLTLIGSSFIVQELVCRGMNV